jgi:Co/Zn/Cd efflux system component
MELRLHVTFLRYQTAQRAFHGFSAQKDGMLPLSVISLLVKIANRSCFHDGGSENRITNPTHIRGKKINVPVYSLISEVQLIDSLLLNRLLRSQLTSTQRHGDTTQIQQSSLHYYPTY